MLQVHLPLHPHQRQPGPHDHVGRRRVPEKGRQRPLLPVRQYRRRVNHDGRVGHRAVVLHRRGGSAECDRGRGRGTEGAEVDWGDRNERVAVGMIVRVITEASRGWM